MSKRQFKSQASSSRAASGTGFGGFGSTSSGSTLSYLTEPPNLSAISDANVVVAFKNLSKKDGTTKAKALEDLRAYVQAHPYEQDGGVEDAVLEAWVRFYPRVSIDNSRRVRELSHILQYELLKSARKRMEKYIPKIVGSWLGGTYDRDRAVARAANDGIKSFLDTGAKMALFYKRCEARILEYAQEALDETPQTLSDERTMSADDIQAKYFRVIGSSISLVVNLLVNLSEEDILKHQDKYESLLSNNKILWAFSTCEDAFVRKTTDQLLVVCLEKQSAIIESDLDLISHTFIAESLRTTQSTSAFQLLNALGALTSKFPQVWTSSYKAKKGPFLRLRSFIERGSQGGPPEYWTKLALLILKLPVEIIPTEPDSSLDFLKSFRSGISNREEPRNNAAVAWSAYFDIAEYFISHLPPITAEEKLLPEGIFPVFEQYLHPTPANASWGTGSNISTLAKGLNICLSLKNKGSNSLEAEWARLENDYTSKIVTSLPEQSKDYQVSQASVIAVSHRWFKLLAEVLRMKQGDSSNLLVPSSQRVLTKCFQTMINRNGKPYSAAATVETALRLTPTVVEASPGILAVVKSFLEDHLPKLILSPSGPYLISILNLFHSFQGQEDTFESIWQSAVDGLLALPKNDSQSQTVAKLIASDAVSKIAQNHSRLQDFILDGAHQAMNGKREAWPLFEAAITFASLSPSTIARILTQILACLDGNEPDIDGALKALEFIAKKSPDSLGSQSSTQVALITKLLSITEISDSPLASRAHTLRSIVEKSTSSVGQNGPRQSSIVHVIRENIETAGPQSLTIETLVEQARNFIVDNQDSSKTGIFPDIQAWTEALAPLLDQTPNPALAVMRPFAGAVFLVNTTHAEDLPRPPRDMNGYSIPLRMAIYTSRLLDKVDFLELIPQSLQVELLYLTALSCELANDQIDLLEDNKLFESSLDPDAMNEVRQFLQEFQGIMSHVAVNAGAWRQDVEEEKSSLHDTSFLINRLTYKLIEASGSSTPTAFYAAKALSRLMQALVSAQRWQNDGSEEWLSKLDMLKTSTNNILGATAILTGLEDSLRTSKIVNNLCNRLISDVAGAKAQSARTIQLLVLLNAVMAVYDDGDLPVANNRLVFAVKQILSWTEGLATTDYKLASEACRTLQKLLPAIKDVYGPHWESALTFCASIWESNEDEVLSNERLPMIGMSLKLLSILRRIDEEANDDLTDALDNLNTQISQGLITLLKLQRSKENQPLEFVDSLLSRQVVKISSDVIDDLSDFYPLVASDFRMIQSAAFDVLHKALPKFQQQISVDVLLEGTTATLPFELLSLLLNTPSTQDLADLDDFPSSVRGYLLSWLIVYDSYATASLKVRNDYSEALKTENYIGPLLNFMFVVLGHSDANPLNLERARIDQGMIRSYDMWKATDSEPNERSMHWQLVNLYYLCLNYTPGLVRTWWFGCESRQTSIAVDSWTRRFFSPLVIEDTLDEVEKWAATQEAPSEDEKELIVKVSKRSREIFAGYEVDELMMQIVIRFPDNYPLDGVKVEGINRVAVSEKKWATWLRNTQGVITFSNGLIIDGLTAFQKNVTGALKGHTECAICYSIIGPDKKTPDKRCQTCNNLFHSNCLYKWFSSSNQSTCPLCRNPFNYGTDTSRRTRG